MIFTNDIYNYIGNSLLSSGFRDIREVPINIMVEKINEFLRLKLGEKDNSLSTDVLLAKLENLLNEQHNKEQMMANFIFCLLWYMSMLQSFVITWRIEEIDTPCFRNSDFMLEKIDSLVTAKNINYIDLFNFVLDEIKKITNNESRVIL